MDHKHSPKRMSNTKRQSQEQTEQLIASNTGLPNIYSQYIRPDVQISNASKKVTSITNFLTVGKNGSSRFENQSSHTSISTRSSIRLLEKHRNVYDLDHCKIGDSKMVCHQSVKEDTKGKPLGRYTLEKLILGLEPKEEILSSDNLLIDDSMGILEVVDPLHLLKLSSLPTVNEELYKRKTTSSFLLPKWNRRFVLLRGCCLIWYTSESQFKKGLQPAGSINFILQSCAIDSNGADSFDIIIESCSKRFTFRTKRESPRKGSWMLILLAHLNRARQIRNCFPNIAWDRIEEEVLHRHHLLDYSCSCNNPLEIISIPPRTTSDLLPIEELNRIHNNHQNSSVDCLRKRSRLNFKDSCSSKFSVNSVDFSKDINKFWKNSYRVRR